MTTKRKTAAETPKRTNRRKGLKEAKETHEPSASHELAAKTSPVDVPLLPLLADESSSRRAAEQTDQGASPSAPASSAPLIEATSLSPAATAVLPARRSPLAGYIVLARRYRPNRFEDVVGQEHITRTLQNAIQAGRVHHAYLFTGSRGVGKTTVARVLAKALECDRGATPTPCLECASCREIKDGTAVDVFEIDGASHTGVDDVRGLRENVRYLPARGRYKIFIIDEVHMLSTSAFNALLKTLEEPPPHVVFILATTEPHKIPATILSRCQRFDFKRMSSTDLIQYLGQLCEQEGVIVERAGLSLIARASEGSMRDALSLLDQVIAYAVEEKQISSARVAEVLGVADRRVLFELSQAILQRQAAQALEIIDRLYTSGHDLAQFTQAFLQHLRDLAVVQSCPEPDPLVEATETELAELAAQAQGPGANLIVQLFHYVARSSEEIARSSFPRLLLEMAVIEMVHSEPVLPLGDLLERLEDLEARLAGTGAPSASPRPAFAPPASSFRAPSSSTLAPQPTASPGELKRRRTRSLVGQEKRSAPVTPAPAQGNTPFSAPKSQGAARPAREPEAAPPARAGASTIEGQTMEQWQQLLRQIEAIHPRVASAYIPGRLLAWSNQRILLGYPAGSFDLQWAKDPTKHKIFEEECTRQLGHTVTVQIQELGPEEANSPENVFHSAMEDRVRKHNEQAQKRQQEAKDHPLTKELIDTLGASIDSIATETEMEES